MLGCGGAKVDPLPCLVLLLQEPRKGRLWDSPELSPLWGLFSRSYQACASSMGDRLFQVCAFPGVGAAVASHSMPGPVHPSLVSGAPAPSPTSPKCAGPGPSVPCARWRVPWPHGSQEAARAGLAFSPPAVLPRGLAGLPRGFVPQWFRRVSSERDCLWGILLHRWTRLLVY